MQPASKFVIKDEVTTISNENNGIDNVSHVLSGITMARCSMNGKNLVKIKEETNISEVLKTQKDQTKLNNLDKSMNLKEIPNRGKGEILEGPNIKTVQIVLKDVMLHKDLNKNDNTDKSKKLTIAGKKKPKPLKNKLSINLAEKDTKIGNYKEVERKNEINFDKTYISEKNNPSCKKIDYIVPTDKNSNGIEQTSMSNVNVLNEKHTVDKVAQENQNEITHNFREIKLPVSDNSQSQMICISAKNQELRIQEKLETIEDISRRNKIDELPNMKKTAEDISTINGLVSTSVRALLPESKELTKHDKEKSTYPIMEKSTTITKEKAELTEEKEEIIKEKEDINKKDNIILKEITVDEQIFDFKLDALKKKNNSQCVKEDDNETKISVTVTHSINLSIADMEKLLDLEDNDDENSDKEYVFVSSDLTSVNSPEPVLVFETSETIDIYPKNVMEEDSSILDNSVKKFDDQVTLKEKVTVKNMLDFEPSTKDVPDLSTDKLTRNDVKIYNNLGQQSISLLKHNDNQSSSGKKVSDIGKSIITSSAELNKLAIVANIDESEAIKKVSDIEVNVSCNLSMDGSVEKISDGFKKNLDSELLVSIPENATMNTSTRTDIFSNNSAEIVQKESFDDFSSTFKTAKIVSDISTTTSSLKNILKDSGSHLNSGQVRLSLDRLINDDTAKSDILLNGVITQSDNKDYSQEEQKDLHLFHEAKTNPQDISQQFTSGSNHLILDSISTSINNNEINDKALVVKKNSTFVDPIIEKGSSNIHIESDHSKLICVETLAKTFQGKLKDFSLASKKALNSSDKYLESNSDQLYQNDIKNCQVRLNIANKKDKSSIHPSSSVDNPLLESSQIIFTGNSKDTLLKNIENSPNNLISQQPLDVNINHVDVFKNDKKLIRNIIPEKLEQQNDHKPGLPIKEEIIESPNNYETSTNFENKELEIFCCDDDDEEISFRTTPWVNNSCSLVSSILTECVPDVKDNSNMATVSKLKNLKNKKRRKHLNEAYKEFTEIKTRSAKRRTKPISFIIQHKRKNNFLSQRQKKTKRSHLTSNRKLAPLKISDLKTPISKVIGNKGIHRKSSTLEPSQSNLSELHISTINSSTNSSNSCASKSDSKIQVPLASTNTNTRTLFKSDESDVSEPFQKFLLKSISNNDSYENTSVEPNLSSHKTIVGNKIIVQLESPKDSSLPLQSNELSLSEQINQFTIDNSLQNNNLAENGQTTVRKKNPLDLISLLSSENSVTNLKRLSKISASQNEVYYRKTRFTKLKRKLPLNQSPGIFTNLKRKSKDQSINVKSKRPKAGIRKPKKFSKQDQQNIWKKLRNFKDEKIKVVKFERNLIQEVRRLLEPYGFIIVNSKKGIVVSRGTCNILETMNHFEKLMKS